MKLEKLIGDRFRESPADCVIDTSYSDFHDDDTKPRMFE